MVKNDYRTIRPVRTSCFLFQVTWNLPQLVGRCPKKTWEEQQRQPVGGSTSALSAFFLAMSMPLAVASPFTSAIPWRVTLSWWSLFVLMTSPLGEKEPKFEEPTSYLWASKPKKNSPKVVPALNMTLEDVRTRTGLFSTVLRGFKDGINYWYKPLVSMH